VPVRKLHRDFKLNMSLPLIGNLIEYYEDSTDIEQSVHITKTIHASLFPEWLKEDSKLVQIQPKNWKYIGKFPLGSWRKNENN